MPVVDPKSSTILPYPGGSWCTSSASTKPPCQINVTHNISCPPPLRSDLTEFPVKHGVHVHSHSVPPSGLQEPSIEGDWLKVLDRRLQSLQDALLRQQSDFFKAFASDVAQLKEDLIDTVEVSMKACISHVASMNYLRPTEEKHVPTKQGESPRGIGRLELFRSACDVGRGSGAHVNANICPNVLGSPEQGSEVCKGNKRSPRGPEALRQSMLDMAQTHVKGKADLVDRKKMHTREMNFFARLINTRAFMLLTSIVILANTTWIGIETDLGIRAVLNGDAVLGTVAGNWINRVFSACFLIELIARLLGQQRDFFLGDEKGWNLFDSILVFSAVLEEIISGTGMSFMRIARILRLVKAVRIIRVVRFFRELRMMAMCILNSLVSLAWALILLFVIMYLFAVVSMIGAMAHLEELRLAPGIIGAEGMSYADVRVKVEESYPTVLRSMLTMLYSISGGNSWGDALKPLMNFSAVFAFLFVFYIMFTVFGVLNVLTGVFVESAMSLKDRDLVIQNEMEKDMRFLRDMRDLFHEMDENGSNSVSWEELEYYFSEQRVVSYFRAQQMDVSDAAFIFKLIDSDKSGCISIEEFCLGCHSLRGTAKCLDVAYLIQETTETHRCLQAMMVELIKKVSGVVATNQVLIEDRAQAYLRRIGARRLDAESNTSC